MVTNQDGLGTESYPEEDFYPYHDLMLRTLENEGIVFAEQLIDRSFEKDNSPDRKPRTGLFTKYFSGEYDLENSFVIGDRFTDVELAKNLGLSLRTFQRITREELHVTPTNYIYIVKLNLAADFLKAKAGNVTEAAYRFGFSDPSYFSRQFKKHFGVSPTEYIQKANH
jgi:histidinol phosphatase-like enzyme